MDKKVKKFFDSNVRTKNIACYLIVDEEGRHVFFDSEGCHLGLTARYDRLHQAQSIYNRFDLSNSGEAGIELFKFMTGEETPWQYLLPHVTAHYYTDGTPMCVQIDNLPDLCKASVFNYCVAHRHCLERGPRVKLWYELVQGGVSKRMAYLFAFTWLHQDGEKFLASTATQHFPINAACFSPMSMYKGIMHPDTRHKGSVSGFDNYQVLNAVWQDKRDKFTMSGWYALVKDNVKKKQDTSEPKKEYPFLHLEPLVYSQSVCQLEKYGGTDSGKPFFFAPVSDVIECLKSIEKEWNK